MHNKINANLLPEQHHANGDVMSDGDGTEKMKRALEHKPSTYPRYRLLNKLGEGTYAHVYRCTWLRDGKQYALKKMKQKYNSIEEANQLREIRALRKCCPHRNIINLVDVIYDRRTRVLCLLTEVMDANLYELIKDRNLPLPERQVIRYMYQLAKAVDHIHGVGVFHRDIKPENVLVRGNLLKLADFGSVRSVHSRQPYTEYISTRWYRSPETLLTDGYYDEKMDIWSFGCVFFEVLTNRPLFPGSNEVDQINKIHELLGTPNPKLMRKFKWRSKRINMNYNFPPRPYKGFKNLIPSDMKPSTVDIIHKLCTYDPDERPDARQVLHLQCFAEHRASIQKRIFMKHQRSEEQSPLKRLGLKVPLRRQPIQVRNSQHQSSDQNLPPVVGKRTDNRRSIQNMQNDASKNWNGGDDTSRTWNGRTTQLPSIQFGKQEKFKQARQRKIQHAGNASNDDLNLPSLDETHPTDTPTIVSTNIPLKLPRLDPPPSPDSQKSDENACRFG